MSRCIGRTRLSFLCSALLIAGLTGCKGRPLPWVDVAPPGAGFKVQMPGNPTMSTKSVPTVVGTVTAQIWEFKQPNTMYFISVADYSSFRSPTATDEAILDGSVGGMVQSGAQLESQTPITLQGYKGREVHLKGPDGSKAINRVYVAGNKQYQLMIAHAPGHSDPEAVQKFQSTFQLVN